MIDNHTEVFQGDMEAFVKALQNKEGKKDDKEKEEDMALD